MSLLLRFFSDWCIVARMVMVTLQIIILDFGGGVFLVDFDFNVFHCELFYEFMCNSCVESDVLICFFEFRVFGFVFISLFVFALCIVMLFACCVHVF